MQRLTKRSAASAIPLLILLIFSCQVLWAQIADSSTMNGKIICGYQGWFGCPGDGNSNRWTHWSKSGTDIGPGLYWTDMWPDITEYSQEDLFLVPNTTLTSGATPYLFSSARPGVTNVHFRWMQENKIDGVLLQRFSVGLSLVPDDVFREHNKIPANVQAAASKYGRVWAIEYDVTGDMSASSLYERLTGDWDSLKMAFDIYDDPRYLRHNGKPVVAIFGMGLDGSAYPVTPELATQIITYFKNEGCWIIGGIPWGWRTLTGGSKTDPAWAAVYRSFNGIKPWTVGAYGDWNSISHYRDNIWIPDLAECNSLGISYHPTAWPRFRWDNMHNYPCSAGIPPRGGQHFWDQVYAMKQAGAQTIFGAMFDEYDESTAFMKMSDDVPTTGCWWTNEGFPKDWHLRLLNHGARMLRGEISLSRTIPITAASSPDNSTLVSHTIPSTMHVGRLYNVAVTMRNTGETCWNAEMFKLGAVGDSDPFTNSVRIEMDPGTAIGQNQQYTFRFPLTAPSTTGTYTTDWRMSHELVRWFGSTLARNVSVTSAADTTAPSAVVSFAAARGDRRVILSWQNPTTADYSGVMIRYKTSGYPTSVTDGNLVVDKPGLPDIGDSYIHTGLVNGGTYYYSAFAHDSIPNYATRAESSASPANIEPPGLVAQFTVNPGVNKNDLSWTNPTDSDFVGTVIRYSTNGYPASITDGLALINRTGASGSTDSYTHLNLINGTTYYYAAFTYDNIPNYSTAATASGMPAGPRVVVDASAFDYGPESWNFSVWKSGPYADGAIAWSNAAGRLGRDTLGGIRCNGSGDSDWEDRCTREGGEIAKTVSTAGYTNIRVSYDLRVNPLGLNLVGGGIGSCWVDHNLIDEQLTVYYSTNGGATWKQTEYLLRNQLLGYQPYGTRTVDLSNVIACNDNPDFALRFRWQLNTASDTADLDNIVVTGNRLGLPDSTPPGPVINFTAIEADRQVSLFWRNPNDNDFARTIVLFKTTGYPAHQADGTLLCDRPNSPDSNDSFSHTGLLNGVTYYYSAFAYDHDLNCSAKSDASGTPVYFGPLQAKLLPDNVPLTLTVGIVSASFTNRFYVQSPDTLVGIRVDKEDHGLAGGRSIGIQGTIHTDPANEERYISVISARSIGTGSLRPVGLGSAALGGSDWNVQSNGIGQRGVEGGAGPNNIGLLVTVWGRVTQRDTVSSSYFYVDDGTGLIDGTKIGSADNVGVRIQAHPGEYPTGSYVVITGIVSLFKDDQGKLRRLILPRPGTIQKL